MHREEIVYLETTVSRNKACEFDEKVRPGDNCRVKCIQIKVLTGK